MSVEKDVIKTGQVQVKLAHIFFYNWGKKALLFKKWHV